jgi:hypothetical protein
MTWHPKTWHPMVNKFVRLLAPIAVAVVLGPLIAGLAVFLFAIVNITSAFGGAAWLPIADLPGLAFSYIVFAYVIGGAIALLAGILVSIWMIWRPPGANVVTAAAAIATAVYLGVGALGVRGPVEQNNARSNFLFTLLLAVIAANGCWLLTRRFARTT